MSYLGFVYARHLLRAFLHLVRFTLKSSETKGTSFKSLLDFDYENILKCDNMNFFEINEPHFKKMRNPGFEPVEQVRADLPGYTRSFCMWSIHHRGTVENPGLVLALDTSDGHCAGVALRAADDDADTVLQMLRDRELISSAYYEDWLPLTLADGRQVEAVTYIINREHEQYCAGQSLEKQAQVIAGAVGGKGPNPEYLYNTSALLDNLGIPDPDMTWLTGRVQTLAND